MLRPIAPGALEEGAWRLESECFSVAVPVGFEADLSAALWKQIVEMRLPIRVRFGLG